MGKSLFSGKKAAGKKGEKYEAVVDSAAVMKKIFTKVILDEGGEMSGFSLKYDRLTNDELKTFSKLNSQKDPLSSADFMQRNGKKLVLNLDQTKPDALIKDSKTENKGEINQMSSMLKMFKMTYNNTIKSDQ